jgi:hypothetical protein
MKSTDKKINNGMMKFKKIYTTGLIFLMIYTLTVIACRNNVINDGSCILLLSASIIFMSPALWCLFWQLFGAAIRLALTAVK